MNAEQAAAAVKHAVHCDISGAQHNMDDAACWCMPEIVTLPSGGLIVVHQYYAAGYKPPRLAS